MNKKMNTHIFTKLTISITLIMVVTLFTQIPILPYGYFNLGDSLLLLFALGFTTSESLYLALGPTLADVLSPYAFYAPYTLVCKGIGIFCLKKLTRVPLIIRVYCTSIIMMIAYGISDVIILGSITAFIPSVIANLPQMIITPIFTLILYKLWFKKKLN